MLNSLAPTPASSCVMLVIELVSPAVVLDLNLHLLLLEPFGCDQTSGIVEGVDLIEGPEGSGDEALGPRIEGGGVVLSAAQ